MKDHNHDLNEYESRIWGEPIKRALDCVDVCKCCGAYMMKQNPICRRCIKSLNNKEKANDN